VPDSLYSRRGIVTDQWGFETAATDGTMVVDFVKFGIEKGVLHVPSAYWWCIGAY